MSPAQSCYSLWTSSSPSSAWHLSLTSDKPEENCRSYAICWVFPWKWSLHLESWLSLSKTHKFCSIFQMDPRVADQYWIKKTDLTQENQNQTFIQNLSLFWDLKMLSILCILFIVSCTSVLSCFWMGPKGEITKGYIWWYCIPSGIIKWPTALQYVLDILQGKASSHKIFSLVIEPKKLAAV